MPFLQHLLTRDSDWGNPTDSRHHTPHNAAANGEIRESMQVASPAVQQRGAGPQIANDTVSENNTRFVTCIQCAVCVIKKKFPVKMEQSLKPKN